MYEELIETPEEAIARLRMIEAMFESQPEVMSDILAEFLRGES